MKRLTKAYEGKYPQTWNETTAVGKVLLRLAAYENTGLEPEAVTELMAAHGTAILELSEYRSIGPAKHFLELAQAERDGRRVVLPFKVGDIVWTNIAIVGDRYKSADKPYPVEVVFIGMGEASRFFHVQHSNGRVFPFDFERLNKTVFLTREEAEAAMKKREEEYNEAD